MNKGNYFQILFSRILKCRIYFSDFIKKTLTWAAHLHGAASCVVCLKSKCKHCKIGCIEIDRNVELELEETKFDALNKPPSPHRKNSINQFNV